MTTKRDVIYSFFNCWTLANSMLIVLAVVNTMDLPERTMTGRVHSRVGWSLFRRSIVVVARAERCLQACFEPTSNCTPPSCWERSYVHKPREGLPVKAPDVISKDGVKFASTKAPCSLPASFAPQMAFRSVPTRSICHQAVVHDESATETDLDVVG